MYSGGSNYNPSQIIRDDPVVPFTEKIDKRLKKIADKTVAELPIEEIQALIELTRPDAKESEHIWNAVAVAESLGQFAKIHGQSTGYVYVDRERGLEESRRETQGILAGGEYTSVPNNRIALFMLRTKSGRGKNPSWWPQIRFPDGNYAFAFAV